MAEIDVITDLGQINTQLEQLVAEYNKKDAEMKQLMQQIQNLSGIAMYLRGKQEGNTQTETSTNNINKNEIPDIAEIVKDT